MKLFTSTIYERKLRRVELFPWWITLLYRIYKEYTVLYNVTGKCCPVEPKSNMIFLNKKWRVSKILSEWLINFSWEKKYNICFIFFHFFGKKIKHFSQIWVSEWPLNLSREKKNATFDEIDNFFGLSFDLLYYKSFQLKKTLV